MSPAARPPPNSLPIPSYHSRSTSHDAAGRGAGGAGGGWVGTWAGGVNGERVEGVVVMVRGGGGGRKSVGVLICVETARWALELYINHMFKKG